MVLSFVLLTKLAHHFVLILTPWYGRVPLALLMMTFAYAQSVCQSEEDDYKVIHSCRLLSLLQFEQGTL